MVVAAELVVLPPPPATASTAAEMLDAAEEACPNKNWNEAAKAYRVLTDENLYNGEFFYRLGTALYNLKR